MYRGGVVGVDGTSVVIIDVVAGRDWEITCRDETGGGLVVC